MSTNTTQRRTSRHTRLLRQIVIGAAGGGLLAGLWGWGLLGFLFAMNAGVLVMLGMSGALDHGRLRARPQSLAGLLMFVALPSAVLGNLLGTVLGG
jgi:uncharacterized membrane protein YjjP (DUF1212 family)